MSSLKQHIGYVSQQPRLFADTVFINLCYRNPDATEQEVFDAATVAGINDFIESTPQGYATLINPNGVNLSGGQKQCLAIARALIKKPDILIFDEPTAALNLKTEKTLFNRLPDVMQSKTLFMVTHRPATIRNCERIILLGENHLVTGIACDALGFQCVLSSDGHSRHFAARCDSPELVKVRFHFPLLTTVCGAPAKRENNSRKFIHWM